MIPGVFILPTLLLAATAVDDGVLSRLPVYPKAEFMPIDGNLTANGVPIDAAVWMTPDGPDQVFDFYKRELTARGIRVIRHTFPSGVSYVGFLHPPTKAVRVATLVPTGRGTMIVLSSMNVERMASSAPRIPDGLPTLPMATDITVVGSAQSGREGTTVSYTVNGLSALDVRKALVIEAVRLGWESHPINKQVKQPGLYLRRGSEICMMAVTPKNDGSDGEPPSTLVLLVHIVEGKPKQEVRK